MLMFAAKAKIENVRAEIVLSITSREARPAADPTLTATASYINDYSLATERA